MSIYKIFQAISMLQLTNPFTQLWYRYLRKPFQPLMKSANKNEIKTFDMQCDKSSWTSCPKKK